MPSSDLPEGWAVASLESLIAEDGIFTDGDWVESKDQDPSGDVRLVQLADIGDGLYRNRSERFLTSTKASELACTFLEPGDILIARMPEPLGRACIFPGDKKRAITVVDICVLRPGKVGPYPGWLVSAINAPPFRQLMSEFERGTTRRRISRRNLCQLNLPVPPLAEQHRIAAKLDELLRELSGARRRLASFSATLRRFRQAVLAAACSGRLTEGWRQRQEPQIPVSTGTEVELDGLPELPITWSYRRADEVVEPGTIITYGIVLPGPEIPGGVPYIRQQDIEGGTIHVTQLRHTTPEIAAKHERSSIRAGDVLLCIIRNLRVAVVPKGIDGANLTQGTVRMRPSKDIVAEYLAAYLESVHAQGWMKQRYIGMSMPRINVEHARAIPIALPPFEEQREIIRRISALFAIADDLEQKLAAATARVEKLAQTILQKAFRGELVNTEAELARREGRDYEPASVLLERIRKERENEAAPARGRKKSAGKRA